MLQSTWKTSETRTFAPTAQFLLSSISGESPLSAHFSRPLLCGASVPRMYPASGMIPKVYHIYPQCQEKSLTALRHSLLRVWEGRVNSPARPTLEERINDD